MTTETTTSCYIGTPSRELSRGIVRLLLTLISAELSYLTDDELVDHSCTDIIPDFTLSVERHIDTESTYSEWKNLALAPDEAKDPTHMSLHQVARILQYQDSEILAEHAIATALDGIPGTYVRR